MHTFDVVDLIKPDGLVEMAGGAKLKIFKPEMPPTPRPPAPAQPLDANATCSAAKRTRELAEGERSPSFRIMLERSSKSKNEGAIETAFRVLREATEEKR